MPFRDKKPVEILLVEDNPSDVELTLHAFEQQGARLAGAKLKHGGYRRLEVGDAARPHQGAAAFVGGVECVELGRERAFARAHGAGASWLALASCEPRNWR